MLAPFGKLHCVSARNRTKKPSRPAPSASSPQAAARSQFPVWQIAAILGATALFVFWPATRCAFVNFDDDQYVTANPYVQNGLALASLKWATYGLVASNWHPLTMISHMLDFQLYGLNPWGHHLTSILLHALNTMLVFILLQQMTGAKWRSAFVAALFAFHPLDVESVAWVSERKNVLSAFFGLLSLLFYVRYARKRDGIAPQKSKARETEPSQHHLLAWDYGLVLFFLALGLLSKGMLVTWPCVMLLLDYWPLQRFKTSTLLKLILEKIPLFVLAAVMCVVTFAVQRHAGAVATLQQLPLAERCENALVSYCLYLGKFFWPINLAVFYPLQPYKFGAVLSAILLLAAISLFAIWRRGRWPFLFTGWFWFLGTLVPVIQLVQAGDQAMADRYLYLPSLGLLILIVWGLYELTRFWHQQLMILAVAGSTATVLYACLTVNQLGYWKNSETLFVHALAVTHDNYIAHNNLAAVLEDRGDYDGAISHLQEAVRIKPYDAPAVFNLGLALYSTGRYDDAIERYQQALRLDPNNPNVYVNLGNVFFMTGRLDDAATQYQQAIRLSPNDARACYDLGKVYETKKDLAEAIRLNSGYADAHNNLGYLLQSTGHVADAIPEYQEAIRLDPDYTLARNNLAAALVLTNAPSGH